MTVNPQDASGLLFLLVGPPGVGKNSLMKAVLARSGHQIRQLPTATTRPIRPDEKQGREHLFVTHETFETMIERDELLEHQVVHGQLYGIPRSTVESAIRECRDLIADIEVLGATYTRSCYPENTVLIFIQPPSQDVLRTRMQARGEPPEEIEKRLKRVALEMPYAPLCDYLITNDDINQAADQLYSIILSVYSRRELKKLRLDMGLPRHRQMTYVTVIPFYNDEVLQRQDTGGFPTAITSDTQLIADTASESLATALRIEVEPDDLCYGIWVTQPVRQPDALGGLPPEYFQQTTLYYFYMMPRRVTLPDWEWLPLEQAALSAGCRESLLIARHQLEIGQ
ncbi:MAG: guanylate kinase [Anaerolineaceae bacterium]|nr:guanylate kinase [Anaerolineaceae bacterium]